MQRPLLWHQGLFLQPQHFQHCRLEVVVADAPRNPPKMGEGQEEIKIVRALTAAFAIAEERRWKSLSFPAISSGIFLVPLPICVRSYLRAVKEFYLQNPGAQLREIRLCLFMGPLLAATFLLLLFFLFVILGEGAHDFTFRWITR